MASFESSISLITSKSAIENYMVEPVQESYENWSDGKNHLAKNVIIKFVCKYQVINIWR